MSSEKGATGSNNRTDLTKSDEPAKTVRKVKYRRKKKLSEKSAKNRIESTLVRDTIVKFVKEKKRAPSPGEIAKEIGLKPGKVSKYINELDLVNEGFIGFAKTLVPDVITAIYRQSMTNTHAAKLFLQVVTNWEEPGGAGNKAGSPTQILNNGGTINFISAIPEKDDGKK